MQGQGDGRHPHSAADKRMALGSVVGMAKQGIADTDLAKAKEEAASVQAALKKELM